MSDSREKLIGTGVRLFTTQGYAATGLQQLVQTAGVPKGSFYNFFASKEAFSVAVLQRYLDVLLAPLETPDAMHDPMARIRAFHAGLIRAIAARAGDLSCMLGGFATEVDSSSTALHAAIAQGIERWVGAYETLISEGQKRGEVRADLPARLIAEMFWNQWQGALAQSRARGSATPVERSLRTMFAMMVTSPSIEEQKGNSRK